MNSATVWTGAAGMSCFASSSTQCSRGLDLNRASMSGSSAWLFSRRLSHEAKRGSSASDSSSSALQSFTQKAWL